MRAIAVCNLKGGVGKTTTVINLAADLAHYHNQRVLVIDADSQSNLTRFVALQEQGYTLSDLLRMEGTTVDAALADLVIDRGTALAGVDLIPADLSLMDLDLTKAERGDANMLILRDLLELVAERYDYVLIDCPPAFNAASAAALVAVSEVIIPIKLDAFALYGMANLMRQLQNMRQINPALRVAGVLPTMWYKSPGNVDAIAQLRKNNLHVFPRIRRTAKVDDMTYTQAPLYVTSPTSGAAVDYKRLAAALMGGED